MSDRAESFAHMFPIPQASLDLMSPNDFYRLQQMAWLGPALIEGQVWAAYDDSSDNVLGVGIWSEPGHLLGDL
jgi:hypothetical protein